MKKKCVTIVALEDISKDVDYNDVGWTHLQTNETARLNKELGISGVNKLRNKNQSKNK